MTDFAALGVPHELVTTLTKRGITTPFPIQAAAIPDGLAGRDVCGRAVTGSGKTLAFGIPLIAKVGRAEPSKPRALILAPTRELAEQIKQELTPLAAAANRSVIAVYGGVSYEPQRRALKRGVDVVVACPGRLADLVRQRSVDLSKVDMVVIDEADRMADMGFLPEVRSLLDMTTPQRQTWLFSATLDKAVAVLTRDYQQNPAMHEVGDAAGESVKGRHLFWNVTPHDRLAHAADVVGTAGQSIVFCRTRHGADRVAKQLTKAGVRAEAIHGGRNQRQRQRALDAFSAGRTQALVATDVAARGIHVDSVAAVIHFDPTNDAKTYMHRSGRTARAGSDGVVVSLVSADQQRAVGAIQRSVGLTGRFDTPAVGSLATGGELVDARRATAPARPQGRGRPNGQAKRRNHNNRRRYNNQRSR